jgi:hypothetical protein
MNPWRVLVIVAIGAVVATGCLTTNPARGVKATGEHLFVTAHGGFRQGDRAIDEQDFYRIAGDTQAVAAVRQRRLNLVAEQMAWQAAGLAGIGGLVVGAGVMAGGIVWTTVSGPIGLVALLPGVGLFTTSLVLVPLAYVWAADAADAMGAPTFSVERARTVAERYNRRLEGATSSSSPRRRRRGTPHRRPDVRERRLP